MFITTKSHIIIKNRINRGTRSIMQKILVTGGTGFIGRNLLQYLVSQHFQVFSLHRSHVDTPIDGVKYIAYKGLENIEFLKEKLKDINVNDVNGLLAGCWSQSQNFLLKLSSRIVSFGLKVVVLSDKKAFGIIQ